MKVPSWVVTNGMVSVGFQWLMDELLLNLPGLASFYPGKCRNPQ